MFGGKQTDGAELTVRRYSVHYIEGCDSTSEGESELDFSSLQRTPKSSSLANPVNSPPLVLAFPFSAYKKVRCPSPSSRDGRNSDQEDQDVDWDEPIEEWMILEEEEQDGDRNIQLNLGYWSSGSSESDSGDEGEDQAEQLTSWHQIGQSTNLVVTKAEFHRQSSTDEVNSTYNKTSTMCSIDNGSSTH